MEFPERMMYLGSKIVEKIGEIFLWGLWMFLMILDDELMAECVHCMIFFLRWNCKRNGDVVCLGNW